MKRRKPPARKRPARRPPAVAPDRSCFVVELWSHARRGWFAAGGHGPWRLIEDAEAAARLIAVQYGTRARVVLYGPVE